MRVMISIPMKGEPNSVIKLKMDKIRNKFTALHIDVADTLFEEEADGYIHPALYYISKSIHAMANCDAVYFAKGWQSAPGCCIERKIAEQYGVKILPDDFLEEPVVESIKLFADDKKIAEFEKYENDWHKDIPDISDKHIPHID